MAAVLAGMTTAVPWRTAASCWYSRRFVVTETAAFLPRSNAYSIARFQPQTAKRSVAVVRLEFVPSNWGARLRLRT
jgi:hypothetical protein